MSTGPDSNTPAFVPQARPPMPPPGRNYLNAHFGVRSWLFTIDHKRIALLYLISVTVMFFLGGFAATLVRIDLMSPRGVFTADFYNKMFTLHGIIMIFFFLVPVIPAVLGNFFLPLMIGAR